MKYNGAILQNYVSSISIIKPPYLIIIQKARETLAFALVISVMPAGFPEQIPAVKSGLTLHPNCGFSED